MFSASYLKDIADAAGAKDTTGVLLEFQNPEKAMRVTINGTVHILMPMRQGKRDKTAADVHAHKFERVIGRGEICACGEATK